MTEPAKMDLKSMNITEDQQQKLRQIFPEVFNEDKIDWDKLRRTLGDHLDTGDERFGMTWPGKNECFKVIQEPSIGTLKPAKEESVDWENTENLFIEGDNLEVIKLLQKSYYGKVKMIYIDPPYNLGKDFIYPDKYSESLETYLAYTGQVDAEGRKFSTNTEADGRFHSKWMNMMYPRLFLSKNLLRDDGVIFISIDEKEMKNLQSICNEVFGVENRIGIVCWKNVTDNNPTLINSEHEYIVVYAKTKESLPDAWKSILSDAKELLLREYDRLKKFEWPAEKIQDEIRSFISLNRQAVGKLSRYKFVDEHSIYTGSESVHNPRPGGYDFEVIHPITKKIMKKPANGYRFPEDTFRQMEREGLILYGDDENRIVKIKKYLEDYEDTFRSVIVMDGRLGSYDLKRVFDTKDRLFDNPKPVDLLKQIVSYATESDDIILDYFSGSCPCAEAVISLNCIGASTRKFIMVQLPELIDSNEEAYKAGYKTVAELGKERVRRVLRKTQESRVNSDRQISSKQEELELKEDCSNPTLPLDLGLRVFKLDGSNFNIWDGTLSEDGDIGDQLELSINHINPESTDEDILYEILLKAGFELTTKIQALELAGKKVYSIQKDALLICIERELTKETITEIAKRQPARVVCLDQGFKGNDQLKTNAVQIMKSHGVEDFRTV